MIGGSSLASKAPGIADRLVDVAIPRVVLSGGWEHPLDLHSFACARAVVIYFYPGCSGSPGDGEETALMDAAQHRAFRDRQPDLEAQHCSAIGISSQSKESQREAHLANRVSQKLLCDPELQLARELGLPTFARHEARWYERLTLIASGGRVEKAFFPVPNAASSAAQVIAWMTCQGCPVEVADDAG
jgi:peroxiredoxin